MNITNASRAISTHDFRVNGEWHIISTSAEYGVTVLSPPSPADRHVHVPVSYTHLTLPTILRV